MNRDLVHKVLRTIKQRTNLLTTDDVLLGADRLEARAPLRGVTLNVPGIAVYLSGYAIERVTTSEGQEPEFEVSTDHETAAVWDVAERLLGLSTTDTEKLFGSPTKRAVLAALEQLAAGADHVNWSSIH
ncbi:hypothetical protein [Streptomyces sp. NPDC056304]|uniref:hypothetical protein n=1 Tax=Streptomyces sp. NPDC056304 TaxID=3345778 RepID=UPI0035DAF66A